MSFDRGYATGFYTGRPIQVGLVGTAFPVALAGQPFMIDDTAEWGQQSVPSLKPYFLDSGDPVGEKTLNPEGLWRRSVISWSKGAGQRHFDRPDSDTSRFDASKGVDPWTRNQLTLLHDTAVARASLATNLALAVAGSQLYLADGAEVYRSADLVTWTPVVISHGETSVSVFGIASDGFTVYAALGANGIHSTTRGASTSTHYSDLAATLVGWAKGRLMAAAGRSIYNVTAPGAAPSSLFDHPNTDWTWVAFADGRNAVYAAGFSGTTSEVYRIGIKTDGSGLDAPIIAGRLLEGEVVRAIYAYAGFVVIGTDQGVRFAVPDDNGDLQIGALVKTGAPCRAFCGWEQFVWFGWDDYDAASTGLGRLDPDVINDSAPAYASDLMVDGQGAVTSIANFLGLRVFTVAGIGVVAEQSSYVASGHLDSGQITYDIPDPKIVLSLDVAHDTPLAGGHSAALSYDGSAFINVGTHLAGGQEGAFTAGERTAAAVELRLTLMASADRSETPRLTRASLFSQPAPVVVSFINPPLLLHRVIQDMRGTKRNVDIEAMRALIESLHRSKAPTVWQEGRQRRTVLVDDFQWLPHKYDPDAGAFDGVMIPRLKVV